MANPVKCSQLRYQRPRPYDHHATRSIRSASPPMWHGLQAGVVETTSEGHHVEHPPEPPDEVPWGNVVLRMLLASVPLAGGALEIGYSTWLERRQERLKDVAQGLHAAADEAELLRAVEENPDVLDLWLRAAEAGQRARIRRARVALGRAVARAATDPARWDEAELLVDALAELREPQAALLARLALLEDEARTVVGDDASFAELRKETGHRAQEIGDEYPMAVHQTLLRHGLAVSHGMSFTGVSSAHETTELGRRLLADLQAAADVGPGEVEPG